MAHLKLYILFWHCLIISVFSDTKSRHSFRNEVPDQNADAVANGIMQLAVDISQNIKSNSAKNEIFSPISIAGALSLLLLGARGQTENELLDVLHLKNLERPHESIGKLLDDLVSNKVIHLPLWRSENNCFEEDEDEDDEESPRHLVSVADALFVQKSFKLSNNYLMEAKRLYKSQVMNVDFFNDTPLAAENINNWVKKATRDKITEIVSADSLSPETKLVVTSALYFKADWEFAFFEGATKARNFYIDGYDNEPIQTESMANGGCFPFYDSPEFDLKIMGFPYKENKTTMYILLPNNSSRSKLQNLQLSGSDINYLLKKMVIRTATILFPKMKIQNAMNMNNILQRLNVRSLFDPTRSNLKRMVESYTPVQPISSQNTRPQQSYQPTKSPNKVPQPSSPVNSPINNSYKPEVDRPASFQGVNIQYPQQTYQSTKSPNKVSQPSSPVNSPINNGNYYKPAVNQEINTQSVNPPNFQGVNIQQSYQSTKSPNEVSQPSSPVNSPNNNSNYYKPNVNPIYFQPQQNYASYPSVSYQPTTKSSQKVVYRHPSTPASSPTVIITNQGENTRPESGSTSYQSNEGQFKPVSPPPTNQYYNTEQTINANNPVDFNQRQRFTTKYPHSTKRPIFYHNGTQLIEVQSDGDKLYYYDNSYRSQQAPEVDKRTYFNRNPSNSYNYNYMQHSSPRTIRNKRQASNDPPLYVGKILHKIFLDINEKGTEGAAATSASLDRISSSVRFRVDAPFLILICHDSTGVPLFYGNVYDPRK